MDYWQLRRWHRLTGLVAALALVPLAAMAQSSEIDQLKREIGALRKNDQERQKRLDTLEREVDRLRIEAENAAAGAGKKAALDRAVEEVRPPETAPPSDLWSRPLAGGKIRLIDVALVVLAVGGTSTATDDEIAGLQAGGHDPNRRGFTLQQAELSLTGAVDPYLTGEAHIVYTSGGVELEEAFLTTQSLPHGLQLEAGHFFTEFGRINPTHPHAWDWIDQPVINTRLFGPDGLRAAGFRLGWLTPLPWFSELHVGAQNAREGETTVSFIGEEGIGGLPAADTGARNLGDLLYLARWNNAWDLTEDTALLFAMSGLHGPNATGPDGDTWIYGGDFKLRWRPANNFRGWPFFLWQSEVMKRDYAPAAGAILRDWGLYTQALYGFRHGWAGGLRWEYAGSRGQSVGGRQSEPLRDDRYRLSPLLAWYPTEYSRFRVQYNYDLAQHLEPDDAHSVWLGAEILYGAHPAHQY
ncbi:MAG: hypothetical protein HY699_11515 [Deltaproteobacteria bacterium]|nr:hypothetical protein [Deltaproteobacteria bacterium]